MLDTKLFRVVLWSAFWVMLSLCLHTRSAFFSMINYRAEGVEVANNYISEDYLLSVVEDHQSQPSFARRPFTTVLIKGLTTFSPLTLGQAFTALNFSLLLLCGPLLYYLARLGKQSTQSAFWSLTLFYSAFSVLFAFFPSIYTYDEPLQYCFCFAALIFWEKKKYWGFVICTALALITRETTLLLLPGMALFILPQVLSQQEKWSWNKYFLRFSYLVFPVLIYAAFLFWWRSQETSPLENISSRWQLIYYNFQNQQFAIESICSMFLGWSWPTIILFFLWKKESFNSKEKAWIKAFTLSLILNTFLVLIATKARETRLFALPLILLWPLAGKQTLQLCHAFPQAISKHYWNSNRSIFSFFKSPFPYLLLALFLVLMFVLHLYHPTGLDVSQNLHKPYCFIFLAVLTSTAFFYFWPKQE